MDAFPYFKNSKILNEVILAPYEQLSQLCQLQIPNRNHGKNPRIDSIFEYSMNFKGVQSFRKNSNKFSKILR
jgi:hypothetical protein